MGGASRGRFGHTKAVTIGSGPCNETGPPHARNLGRMGETGERKVKSNG